MITMEKAMKMKFGDRVYFRCGKRISNEGTFMGYEFVEHEGRQIRVQPVKPMRNGTSILVPISDIFADQDEMMDAVAEDTAQRISEQEGRIKDAESLLRYIFETGILTGVDDPVARQIALHHGKKLFGLESPKAD